MSRRENPKDVISKDSVSESESYPYPESAEYGQDPLKATEGSTLDSMSPPSAGLPGPASEDLSKSQRQKETIERQQAKIKELEQIIQEQASTIKRQAKELAQQSQGHFNTQQDHAPADSAFHKLKSEHSQVNRKRAAPEAPPPRIVATRREGSTSGPGQSTRLLTQETDKSKA